MERSVPEESHQGTVSAVVETRSIKGILSLRANEQRVVGGIGRQLDSFVGIMYCLSIINVKKSTPSSASLLITIDGSFPRPR